MEYEIIAHGETEPINAELVEVGGFFALCKDKQDTVYERINPMIFASSRGNSGMLIKDVYKSIIVEIGIKVKVFPVQIVNEPVKFEFI